MMNFLAKLKQENLAVKQAPTYQKLTQYQAELQAGKFDLLILNPNEKKDRTFRRTRLTALVKSECRSQLATGCERCVAKALFATAFKRLFGRQSHYVRK